MKFPNIKKYLLPLIIISLLTSLPSRLHAATTTNWQDVTSNNGTFNWADGANWDNGIPTTSTFQSVITHSTGDLVINTASPYTISAPTFIVNSGSLTVKLGANLTSAAAPVVTNVSNDTSKMVFDTNGFTLSFAGLSSSATNSYFTLKSTAVGGTGTALFNQLLAANHLDVQNNVTLQVATAGTQNLNNCTFSSGSTIYYSAAGSQFTAFGAAPVGNVIVGNSANANLSYFNTNIAATYRVAGNFTLNKGTTANQDGYILFGSSATKIYVGGNFTDVGGSATSSVASYATTGGGAGTIIFNGGAGSQRSVSIGRTALTNNFQLGESSSIAGNIALAKSLSTTGAFTSYRGSILNVGALTLTAGTMNLSDDAIGTHLTLADTFGTTNGLVTTSGNLSLNTFNLQLNFDGTSWANGSNLLLFHYGGTFTGTLALGTITYNGGPGWNVTSAGTLLNSGGNIYLQNVNVTAVPEPSSMALLFGAFGGLIVWTLRRKKVRHS